LTHPPGQKDDKHQEKDEEKETPFYRIKTQSSLSREKWGKNQN
jgi:hypothetical protein